MIHKLLFILLATATMIFPKISFAQVPNLGTAADFVLFTTNGAATNTGITHLTGHVGSNVGGSTGFGNVDGVMHDQDPGSAAATVDLNAAYLQLDAAVATLFPGILFGNGQTLNAGVYNVPANATMNGELNLDGQGDPNALFIIQIEGTFATNTNSKVNLLNGALACNVFWKVEGQLSLATGTTMRGTLVANNSAISIGAGVELEGRALAINGAVGVDAMLGYTPLGCLAPILTGPPNQALGSTECFVIFSGIGDVTNVGVTTVTGDVGANNGTTVGFNPLLVTGDIHPVPDGATVQCATDFTSIYDDLSALPYDIELLYPNQLGNSLVLTPHVYLMNSAVTFTDTLFLNAQGNSDAVFVFQVYGAFGTSTYSNVTLTNGAQAKNVYWLINGALDINDYSNFSGTIISQGAINLMTGVTLYGRALTGVGSVSTSAIDAIMPTSCSPFASSEPMDTVVCEGTSASFTITSSGMNLTYQWRRGSVNLVDGANISGATTSSLTINPAMLADQATDYNVIVSGSFNPTDTSNYVSLTIDEAPAITLQPVDLSACEGDSVGFSVVATGLNLSYQWRKGLVNLIDGGSISGSTSSMLTINPTSFSDAALDYNVVVTSTCSPDAVSNDVILTVDMCGVDLSISKTTSELEPLIRTTVVFTIIATNLSAQNATGVEVDEQLQSGFSYVSHTVPNGSFFDPITGIWIIGNLNSGASETMTITVTVLESGVYSNLVSIYGNETESDTLNNSASITLEPIDFHIPEGFSPNGDLINDLFVIRGISRFPSNHFTVFNRWGNLVFEAQSYTNTWDGTSQSNLNIGGDELPVGTYFYVLDLGDGSDIYKGTIYLNK